MPKIKFTLRETLQLISALPYLRQLSTGIHITREMRMNTFAHRLCRGKCYLGWRQTVEYSDDGSDSDASSSASADLYNDYLLSCGQDVQQLKAFMTDHLPNIYTSLGFVDELYTRYYPLSTTLSILDGCTYDGNMVFAQCRMFAILAALCPSVQRVQAGWIDDTSHLTTRSDTNRYISREEIEGTRQHADLVRRLQQLQAV
ncbi:hypothetical protein EC988_006809 [Linderina pennispora]|nr:hypothetical protein EC988_006809 [Linderina pennispora]